MAGILAERRNRLLALKKMRQQGTAPTVEEKTCPHCERVLNDDDLASSRHGSVPVEVGRVHVLQRVLPPPDVEGVAVGEERHAPVLPHDVRDYLGVVRSQEREVAVLAEVQLDGDELPLHVDVADPCGADHSPELVQEAVADAAAHVGEVYLGAHATSRWFSV